MKLAPRHLVDIKFLFFPADFSDQNISDGKIFRRKVLKYFSYELLKIFDHQTAGSFIIFTYFQCQYVAERRGVYCYIFTKLNISLPHDDGVRLEET